MANKQDGCRIVPRHRGTAILSLIMVMLVAANMACRTGRDHAGTPTAGVATPSGPEPVNKLIPEAHVPFRVDFDLTSDGVAQGTVVWRQAAGARRLDYSLSAPEPHGGFEIVTKFSEKAFPVDYSACNWVARDASVLTIDCGVSLDVGGIADNLRSAIVLGVSDRALPARPVLGISTQCIGLKHTLVGNGGEICLDPTRHIPLYYANDSGEELVASTYNVNAEESAFSADLVTRLAASRVAAEPSSTLELP